MFPFNSELVGTGLMLFLQDSHIHTRFTVEMNCTEKNLKKLFIPWTQSIVIMEEVYSRGG